VFEPFLDMALLTQKIPFSHANFDKYAQTRWQSRGWAWVDPLKDMQAKILGVNSGFETGQNIAAETGQDLEEIYQQLALEKELRGKYNLTLTELEEKSDGSFAPNSE
jgi:capsid protein